MPARPQPAGFREAVAALRAKGLVPSNMTAAQWEAVAENLRRQAFFSARVTNADQLQLMRDLIERAVNPEARAATPGSYMDKPRFRELVKEYLESIGYQPEPGKAGGLQDLASDARLNVIFETNTRMAQGAGRFAQANNPNVVDAFPAQELFRLSPRREPRDWPARWRAAGGRFFGGGRMIALKDSPVWAGISRWASPAPPYDYGSGMWVRSIAREEAEALGVLPRQASAKGLAGGLLDALVASLGGRAEAKAGVLFYKERD
jgi:hypothetical protein